MTARVGGPAGLVSVVVPPEPSCGPVLAVIQCYVDVECDARTMVAIARHLDRCPTCRAELEVLRWLKAAVQRCGGAQAAARGEIPRSELYRPADGTYDYRGVGSRGSRPGRT